MKNIFFLIALVISTISSAQARSIFDGKTLSETQERLSAWVWSQQLIGEALYRSKNAVDDDCEKQWQIPIMTGVYREGYPDDIKNFLKDSYGFGLMPDAGVLYAVDGIGLAKGDTITSVEGDTVSVQNMGEMTRLDNRMIGWNSKDSKERSPFSVKNIKTGQVVTIEPYQTCRGRIAVSIIPTTSKTDSYYSTFIYVDLESFVKDITPDEVLWMTLWAQGFSITGQNNIAMLVFTRGFIGAVKGYMTGSATNSVIQAGTKSVQNLARETASQLAQSAATKAAKEAVIDAAKSQAEGIIQDTMIKTAVTKAATRFGTSAVGNTMSLESIFVESAFAKADVWAFTKLIKLGVDTSVVVSLHKKLVEAKVADSPFVLNQERQQQFDAMLNALEISKSAGNVMTPTSASEVTAQQEK